MLLRLFTSIESIGCEYYVTVCPLSSSAYSEVTLTAWNVRRWEYLHHVAIAVHSLSRVRLCDAMDCSRPGFPVHHQLLELAHTHVHQVRDAIQPSHPLLSSFSFCHPSFPASGPFPMNWLFASCGQSIGASASASVLPMNIQGWFPLGLTGWISLQSKGLTLKSLLQHHSSKASILRCSTFFMVQLSHPYVTIGETIVLTRWTVAI